LRVQKYSFFQNYANFLADFFIVLGILCTFAALKRHLQE